MQTTRRRKQKAKKDVARITKQAQKLKQQNVKTVSADALKEKS
jgi:uncharacterized protein (DUF3084 family)